MKCDKCGSVPNPGDQICINCGAKLSLENAIVPNVETSNIEVEKKSKNYIIWYVLGALLLIALIIFVTVIITIGIIK